jgi:hypothetical protein
MLAVALAGLVMVAVAPMAGFGDDKPQAQEPKGPHEFKLPLTAGQGIPVVWKTRSTLKEHTGHGMVTAADLEMTAEMLLSILKPADKGQVQARLAFKRVYGRAEVPDGTAVFDTASPETIKLDNDQASYIGRMTGAPGGVRLDGSGKLVIFEPDEGVMKGVAESFKDTEGKDSKVKAVQEFMRHLAGDPFAYVPAGPAKIDEVWRVQKRVCFIHPTGLPTFLDEVSDCKLVSVTDTPRGRIAKVEVAGKVVLPDKDKKKELAEYEVYGAMRVNLDKGCLKWHVQLVAHVKDTDDDSDQISHTITTDVMTGEDAEAAASRPASAPVSRPATQAAQGA